MQSQQHHARNLSLQQFSSHYNLSDRYTNLEQLHSGANDSLLIAFSRIVSDRMLQYRPPINGSFLQPPFNQHSSSMYRSLCISGLFDGRSDFAYRHSFHYFSTKRFTVNSGLQLLVLLVLAIVSESDACSQNHL